MNILFSLCEWALPRGNTAEDVTATLSATSLNVSLGVVVLCRASQSIAEEHTGGAAQGLAGGAQPIRISSVTSFVPVHVHR